MTTPDQIAEWEALARRNPESPLAGPLVLVIAELRDCQYKVTTGIEYLEEAMKAFQ